MIKLANVYEICTIKDEFNGSEVKYFGTLIKETVLVLVDTNTWQNLEFPVNQTVYHFLNPVSFSFYIGELEIENFSEFQDSFVRIYDNYLCWNDENFMTGQYLKITKR